MIASFDTQVYSDAIVYNAMPIPKKLMTTSMKELSNVVNQLSEVSSHWALPVCHDHCSILKSLLERVIPRTLFIIRSLLQNGEFLVKISIDEGQKRNYG